MKITVLFNPKKISISYTMYPFWISHFKSQFKFTTNLNWVKNNDKNNYLLMVGWFSGQDEKGYHKKLLEQLKGKYQKISFFDDGDGSESHYLDLLPFFHKYYKKQAFLNRQGYLKEYYGKRIFTDFYHHNFGIIENPAPLYLPKISDSNDLGKIKVLWNLGFGKYPLSKHGHKIEKIIFDLLGVSGLSLFVSKRNNPEKLPSPSLFKCHARFGFKGYRPTIGFQRKLFSETVQGESNFLSGLVPLEVYNKEVKNVKAILSPFGWGEICFRDFEAVLNGAVLVKPNMDHIETWPDVFVANQTYLPVNWDGSNLITSVEELLTNQTLMNQLRKNAWETLHDSQSKIEDKILEILKDFHESQ